MLLRILVVALVVWAAYLLIRRTAGSAARRSRFPCATCRHCKTLFDDGVLCMFGRKEVFKNETHIANCVDWQKRRA